jgi:hypothetical protein
MNFPVAVRLKRLAAPRLVFNLGILNNTPHLQLIERHLGKPIFEPKTPLLFLGDQNHHHLPALPLWALLNGTVFS